MFEHCREFGPNAWLDLSTLNIVYGPNQDENPNERICTNTLASTLDRLVVANPSFEQDTNIIILCSEALVRGAKPFSQPSIQAIAALPGDQGLYEGKTMHDIVYATYDSVVLIHELRHVTQMASCKFLSSTLCASTNFGINSA